jgi:hypothetical protein
VTPRRYRNQRFVQKRFPSPNWRTGHLSARSTVYDTTGAARGEDDRSWSSRIRRSCFLSPNVRSLRPVTGAGSQAYRPPVMSWDMIPSLTNLHLLRTD